MTVNAGTAAPQLGPLFFEVQDVRYAREPPRLHLLPPDVQIMVQYLRYTAWRSCLSSPSTAVSYYYKDLYRQRELGEAVPLEFLNTVREAKGYVMDVIPGITK
ncbi:hypothetical protein EMMF5_004459 [Cystobasidiomycetes sp. EMM_F5]